MDSYTAKHLADWIEKTFLDDERDDVLNKILSFLYDYPELVNDRSWPEIYTLAIGR
jgi:hypothetical protein